jgi:hypothetical protein
MYVYQRECRLNEQPEFPHNARILSPMQRDLAVWRLQEEAGAGEGQDDTTTKEGFMMALKDPKVSL